MESARVANEVYWNSIINLQIDSNLDLSLVYAQLKQIINNPSYTSLISVLREGLSQHQGEKMLFHSTKKL